MFFLSFSLVVVDISITEALKELNISQHEAFYFLLPIFESKTKIKKQLKTIKVNIVI